MKKKTIAAILIAIINAVSATANTELIEAMRDEMQRSMQNLFLEDLQKPYFIEYILRTEQNYKTVAELGTITRPNEMAAKSAFLTVRVRVGDYKFDNSNFTNGAKSFFGSTTADDNERYIERSVPINMDYNSLRRELWLATDAAYKDAAEDFAAKVATQKNIIRKDTTWDFSKAEAARLYDTTMSFVFYMNNLKSLAEEASAVFLKYPKIAVSNTKVNFSAGKTYYLNSEGIEYVKKSGSADINIAAVTQAEDGSAIYNYYSFISKTPAEFPAKDSVVAAAKQVAEKIMSAMSAKTLDDTYSGPMLFLGQAACEVVAQAFATNLAAQKSATFSSFEISYGDGIYGNTKTFQNKIGGRILPEFMSLEDLPSIAAFQNTNLLGNYKFDDDGIPAKDLLLVDKGYLKTLLSDRTPIKRINTSNGHKRNGTITYSNLKLTADKSKQLNENDLKKQMLKLCKDRDLPYGIIVRRITNKQVFVGEILRLANLFSYSMQRTILPLEIYKLYPDGREELLRDVELGGISAQTFKEILQTGDNYNVQNLTAAAPDWFSNAANVSIIAPNLLFEDCELRVVEKDNKKLPILQNPLSEK